MKNIYDYGSRKDAEKRFNEQRKILYPTINHLQKSLNMNEASIFEEEKS